MWVVKIGGSLMHDARLPRWLQMLAALGGGRVTLVPGGGGFADGVRQIQQHWGFDDLSAHNMAVLAMAQVAELLHALEPGLTLARHEADILAALHAGRTALWQPLPLLRQESDEITSWEVSSDSLALWLARRLNAERLVIVKACRIDDAASLGELGRRGVLDQRFAEWARDAAFPIEVLCCDDVERLQHGLVGGEPRGGTVWTSAAPPLPRRSAAEAAVDLTPPRRRRLAKRATVGDESAPASRARKLPH